MKEDPLSVADTTNATGLTTSELRSVLRLIIKRPAYALDEDVPACEAVLLMACGVLKGYGFDWPSVLTTMARMWAWLEGDDDRCLMLNVVDRRYVGWSCLGRSVLIDAATGDDVSPSMAMPSVLESVAYNLYELLDRRAAVARGERASLWEGRDAEGHTARGAAEEGGEGLGEPQVIRNNVGSPLS